MKDQDWTVVRMLNWATDYFQEKSVASPRLSIEWLLAETLNIRRLDLYMQYDRPLTREELDRLRPLVKRRAEHEPLQYITGSTDFYNCRFLVKPGVLIPRPETEQLVEIVLNEFRDKPDLRVLDVGTGSGCIAVSLKFEQPGWKIKALDNSPEALQTAKSNAELNEVEVEFFQADYNDDESWMHLSNFDLIISNPPYIPEDEFSELDPQVRNYEPTSALYAEEVAQPYAQLSKMGESLLTPGGVLFAELNNSYHQQIASLFNGEMWSGTEIINDYGGTPRFLKSQFHHK